MAKYVTIKLRLEILGLLRSCQLPNEPLSDTLEALISAARVQERLNKKAVVKASAGGGQN